MAMSVNQYYPDYSTVPMERQFNPYADNGGTVVAIAGDDFVVIGADTRLSSGFTILTRNEKKLFRLSDTTVLGCSGCWCDILTLTRILQSRMQMYQQEHNKTMSTPACAQMLSTMLYYKRFFPYYISNILAGFDNEGKGCVFNYDPIGHCEKTTYRVGGSSSALMQPLLDNLVRDRMLDKRPLTRELAIEILKGVFISAAERQINTGDGALIYILTKDGIKEETMKLRLD